MSNRKTRIADIAARVGVSTATVSRAISGKGYVRDDLAERIKAAAHEMNYGLPGNYAGTQVLLAASNDAMVDFQRSQFTLHVLDGLRERAEHLGIAIDHQTFRTPENPGDLPTRAAAEDVLGTLFLSIDDSALTLAHQVAGPVVLVNCDDPEMRLSSVTPCNRSAAALAAKHLVDLGHERILFLTKPGRRTIQRRLEGVQDVLGDRFDPALVVEATDWTAEAAQAAIAAALAKGTRFTAVLAAGDVLGAGALVALQDAGVRVPEDVSVIGIDGLPQGALLSPPLTTVSIPMQAVGAMALDLLCMAARAPAPGAKVPASRVELACNLTPRASTGQVKP